VWDEETEQWYFAVVDVVAVLSDSSNPRRYWSDLKRKLKQEGAEQLYEKIVQLKMIAQDGRKRNTDCANTESLLRIIQSVPSPKAEPFKQWLARVGRERLEEIADPELAVQRAREFYQKKGYSEEWIEARLRGLGIRNELTDEWKNRGVKEGMEYAILTNEISKGTFDITAGEHKKLKKLKQQNLRDHMNNAELVFTMLGELTTTEIARKEDVQGFDENKEAAQKGGKVAGDARRNFEQVTGRPVVSEHNYLERPESEKLPSGEDEEDSDITF
jgi:hypothetical protein